MNDKEAQELSNHVYELMESTELEQNAIIYQCETIKAILKFMKPKFTAAEWTVYMVVIDKKLKEIIQECAKPEGTKKL